MFDNFLFGLKDIFYNISFYLIFCIICVLVIYYNKKYSNKINNQYYQYKFNNNNKNIINKN